MIPALKEVSIKEITSGQDLWGWWDGQCSVWHVKDRAFPVVKVEIEASATGADWGWVYVEGRHLGWCFDATSRLLVAQ